MTVPEPVAREVPQGVIPAPPEAQVEGYLIVVIEEATGNNKNDEYMWDQRSFEGYVRVDLRGPNREKHRAMKGSTSKQRVVGSSITWKHRIIFELPEYATELRIMVVRDRMQPNNAGKKATVLAACGIFVKEILPAVPIDKYFELFKPQTGQEGGWVRVGLNFVETLEQLEQGDSMGRGVAAAINPPPSEIHERKIIGGDFQTGGQATADRKPQEASNKKGGGAMGKIVRAVILFGIIAVGVKLATADKRQKKDEESDD